MTSHFVFSFFKITFSIENFQLPVSPVETQKKEVKHCKHCIETSVCFRFGEYLSYSYAKASFIHLQVHFLGSGPVPTYMDTVSCLKKWQVVLAWSELTPRTIFGSQANPSYHYTTLFCAVRFREKRTCVYVYYALKCETAAYEWGKLQATNAQTDNAMKHFIQTDTLWKFVSVWIKSDFRICQQLKGTKADIQFQSQIKS